MKVRTPRGGMTTADAVARGHRAGHRAGDKVIVMSVRVGAMDSQARREALLGCLGCVGKIAWIYEGGEIGVVTVMRFHDGSVILQEAFPLTDVVPFSSAVG